VVRSRSGRSAEQKKVPRGGRGVNPRNRETYRCVQRKIGVPRIARIAAVVQDLDALDVRRLEIEHRAVVDVTVSLSTVVGQNR